MLTRAQEEDIEYIISCTRHSVEQSVNGIERGLSDLWMDTILNIASSSILEGRMCDETFVLKMEDGSKGG